MSEAEYFLKRNGKVERVAFPYEHGTENTEWNSIPREDFLSTAEIAEHQLQQMSVDSRKEFMEIPKDDLIGLHHGYGMWIRNNYGLWHPNNPHVIPNDMGDGHPDGLSQRTIEEMHRRLNTFVPAYDSAMAIVQEKK